MRFSLRDKLRQMRAGMSDSSIRRLRAWQVGLARLWAGGNLRRLARHFNCVKMYGTQSYGPHYELHFSPFRRRQLNVLEIGIGGYDNPRAGGASLRLWKAYFPRAHIFAIDLADGSIHEQRRIKTFQGDQGDVAFLKSVAESIGRLDIVIDDGSHRNDHVILGFHTLFPYLAPDGIYVVEDTQTSYWAGMGGDTADKNNPATMMGFFKGLVDGLNHAEYELDQYTPTSYDRQITGIHFYHNLVFVQKGDNTAPSNILGKRW
jgi:hypothetical protein